MIHQGKKPLGIIDTQCKQFVEPFKNSLADLDLVAFQSFDLQNTRAMHEGCTCPHHGTSQCTCELIVLLVYGAVGEPVSLVLDGRDGQTHLFIVDEMAGHTHDATIEMIELAVEKTVSSQAARS